MENQGATQIAQKYDRDGKRTIGSPLFYHR